MPKQFPVSFYKLFAFDYSAVLWHGPWNGPQLQLVTTWESQTLSIK